MRPPRTSSTGGGGSSSTWRRERAMAPDDPVLSVVIPSYNDATLLPQQLAALQQEQWSSPWEVIVVDNRSTDGTADLVRRHAEEDPRVRLVSASERQGLAYARNTGVAASRGDYVAFCDADDVVGPGWVAAIGAAVLQHRAVTGSLEV